MLTRTLLFLLLVSLYQSACTLGCLQCDSDICKVCDLSRFYYLTSDNQCELIVKSNCRVAPVLSSDLCVQCNDNYFVDEITKTCNEVPDSKKDINCLSYSARAECSICKPAHIITEGACVAPTNIIQDCAFQLNETTCSYCASGYELNNDFSACTAFETTSNCLQHQKFICGKCKDSFVLAINSRKLEWTSVNALENQLSNMFFDNVSLVNSSLEDCIKKVNTQCLEFDTYGRCQKCSASYYPDQATGQCVLSPETSIYKCHTYEDSSTCLECQFGYYLQNGSCHKSNLIDNCETYNTSSNECFICKSEYHAFSGKCKLRINSYQIDFCKSYSPNSDTCSNCVNDYILSSDKKKCFTPISFCTEYDTTSLSSTLTCKKCADTTVPSSLLNAISCIPRTGFCKTFTEPNSNDCLDCHKGYFLSIKTCTLRQNECNEYKENADGCKTCLPGNFKDVNICRPYTVKNCKNFNIDLDTCVDCEDGMYIDLSTNDCQLYNLPHCGTRISNENKCQLCSDGYYLTNNTCVPYDLIGCNIKKDNENKCTTCQAGYYLNSNTSSCIPHTQVGCNHLSLVANDCDTCFSDYTKDSNNQCRLYTVTHCSTFTTYNKCLKCNDGYILDSNLQCVPINIDYCIEQTGSACTKCQDNYYVETLKCSVQYVPNCETYNSGLNTCSSCRPGYVADSAACKKKEIDYCTDQTTLTSCSVCVTGYYWSNTSSRCKPENIEGCEDTLNNASENCLNVKRPAYYLEGTVVKKNLLSNCKEVDSNGNTSVCLKCYDSHILDSGTCHSKNIAYCLTYATKTTCEICENFYHPNPNTACAPITSSKKSDCLKSDGKTDACISCKGGFKKNAGSCTAVTITDVVTENCYSNTTESDSCTTCNVDHMFINVTTKRLSTSVGCYGTKDNACLGIKEGFEFKDPNVLPASPTSKCLMLKEGEMKLLDQDTFCQKCRNYETHYLSNGTCTVRSITNCGVFNPKDDDCLACIPGLNYNSLGSSTPNDCNEAKQASDDTSNCLMTEKSKKGCYKCKPNFIVHSSTRVCINSTIDTKGCLEGNETAKTCNRCDEGYLLTSESKCIKNVSCFRNKIDQKCTYCWPGYTVDLDNTYNCKVKVFEDDCKIIGAVAINANEGGYCARCKDPSRIPYNKGISTLKYKYKCLPYPDSHFANGYLISFFESVHTNQYFAILPSEDYYITNTFTFKDTTINSSSTKTYCFKNKVENCKTYDYSVDIVSPCKKCNNGMHLDTDLKGQKCVSGGLDGCLEYTSQNVCKVCNEGYVQDTDDTKICKKINVESYCKVYNQSVEDAGCELCETGYHLFNNGCIKNMNDNCTSFASESNECYACKDDYYLDNNVCMPHTISNCVSSLHSEDLCVKCEPGYYLKEGLCLQLTIVNCKKPSMYNNSCSVCEDGFYMKLVDNTCHREYDINCVIYNQYDGLCITCRVGYYASFSKNLCLKYSVTNCHVYTPSFDRCNTCNDGFYVNNGICTEYTVANCIKKVSDKNMCKLCNEGYYIGLNGDCYPYTVTNCSIFHDSSNTCVSCLPGHFLVNLTCKRYQHITNCTEVDPVKDACLDCITGYYLSLGKCHLRTVTDCATYMPDIDICIECKDNFFLQNNFCMPYTNKCAQYNTTSNDCLTCESGKYLNKGMCLVNTAMFCNELSEYTNGCTSCLDGFFLYNKSQCLSRENSKNCLEPLLDADLCKTCPETHYIAAGICISYSKTTCKKFDEVKDLCESCIENEYFLSNNICEPYTVTNCKSFEEEVDACKVCVDGPYYLGSKKTCLESTKVEKCVMYARSSDGCIKCEENYYPFNNSTCRPNPNGIYKCLSYSDKTTCIACDEGFYLIDNYCEKSRLEITSCSLYTEDGVCSKCIGGYSIMPNPQLNEKPVPANATQNVCLSNVETSCATFTDINNCATCVPNFLLRRNSNDNQVCLDSFVVDCLKAEFNASGNKCLECVAGQFPVNGVCKTPDTSITGCKVYRSEGFCLECNDNFTLSSSNNDCIANYSLMSSNCAMGIQKSNPVCRMCAAGHQLDANFDCIKCGGSNCAVCDPYNLTKCIMCQVGFNHTGSACIESVPLKKHTDHDHVEGNALRNVIMILSSVILWLMH